jgi:hypothetical protein
MREFELVFENVSFEKKSMNTESILWDAVNEFIDDNGGQGEYPFKLLFRVKHPDGNETHVEVKVTYVIKEERDGRGFWCHIEADGLKKAYVVPEEDIEVTTDFGIDWISYRADEIVKYVDNKSDFKTKRFRMRR